MKKSLWFKAKRYGWGWYPVTWQGWLITLLFAILIAVDFQRIDLGSRSIFDALIHWIPDTVFLAAILCAICFFTGERPAWRWGGKEKK